MAYQRKYYLQRVLQVQETYLSQKEHGSTDTWIYRNIIEPQYHISMSTFRKYMGINARKELKELTEKQNED